MYIKILPQGCILLQGIPYVQVRIRWSVYIIYVYTYIHIEWREIIFIDASKKKKNKNTKKICQKNIVKIQDRESESASADLDDTSHGKKFVAVLSLRRAGERLCIEREARWTPTRSRGIRNRRSRSMAEHQGNRI